ncbi:hypothetical protein Sjap_009144 [Stephania japonica]|uniref:Uncharacterized protein n=1 Tax=Stephania japonica TaxID=461633 RepID=A0AAP0PFA2_9MAGN
MKCLYEHKGKAMNASDCLAISAFLWCMSATAFTSPTVSPVICTMKPRKQNKLHKNKHKAEEVKQIEK